WTFTPSENFHDFDVPLIFAVEDGSGGTDTAVALVDVIAVPVLPEAENVNPARVGEDHGQIFSAEQLLSNTSAVEDDLLSATSFTMNPAYENIVDNGDGTWSLTPPPRSEVDAFCTNHGGPPSCAERPGASRQTGAKPPGHPTYPLPADIRILPSAIFRKNTHFAYTKNY
ncbi:MAG: cadherin-like domain-containing protein, partial [Coriobacteriia bacterium]|nr:cadherin-like domain-containing protein [Coriobacteriia bacterium]